MKTINDILSSVKPIQIIGDANHPINNICIDSRKITNEDLFIAIQGEHTDGHQFIETAIEQGAAGIICNKLPQTLNQNICYIQVENTTSVTGIIAANFFDHPSKKIKLVGITGTNGKTTCTTLLFKLFSQLGYKCGLISTIQNQIADTIIPATHTTPDAISLQSLLDKMYEENCTHVFMEVSSHAIHQQRIAGAQFAVACFTNITHDHLDYHKTFDEYIRVKKMFFDSLPKSAVAISNIDDKRGMIMLQNTEAKKRTYSLKNNADYKGKIIENNLNGLMMSIANKEVYFKMAGTFNAYNLLCVYATAIELGEKSDEVLQILSSLNGAEGRFDYIFSNKENIMGVVDYAHTPDALLNILAAINKLRKGNETLTTIVGCGGDRDKTKRPLMALVACEHSDKVIFTSDNPRSENPDTIIKEMEIGVPVNLKKKYISIADRREAIKTACHMANNGDIILLAGKGHEKYQEVKGTKYPFDDKIELINALNLLDK